MNGRNLTPDEVEDILDKLENLIAITAMVNPEGFENPADWEIFAEHRDAAGEVWSKSARIIDGDVLSVAGMGL